MNSDNQKVTLLGATGFLGSAIADVLDKMQIPWTGICIGKSSRANVVALSPDDKESLIDIINAFPIVINATGSLKPKDFEEKTSQSLNLFWKNVEHFTDVLEQSNVEMLVHLSSAGTVYGDRASKEGHKERSILKPISWYGKAKMLEELHYEKIADLIGFKYLCVRITNPFGNKVKARHGFIDVLLHCMREGKEFNYFADCDPVRDFVYAPDMSRMIINLVMNNESGTNNIGSGIALNLSKIAHYVKERVDTPYLINRTLAKPNYDVLNSIVCIDKVKSKNAYVNTMNVYNYIDTQLLSTINKI
jgi:UDP-glucose 4-epimerase